jgi:general secretion pathway protein C
VERLFKRHFWVVHLVFIGGVGLLVGRTGNAFVESALLPPPGGRTQQKAAVAKVEPQATLALERLAKLTGLKVPEPEPPVTEPQVPVVDLNAAPVRTSLRVRLLGTLVNEASEEWSVASVQDVATLKGATYMLHDHIQGAEVVGIERLRVVIINNNRREFIDGTAGDGTAVAVVPPVHSDQPPPGQALGAGVKLVSDNTYEIPRAEIDKTLANLNDVAMQARIVPAFKDGKAQGFKLFSIRPDSIYTQIGIQNGDVIQRINGYDLNSPEKALEIYSKLKESSRIDIEVERNGASVKKTYNVR